MSQRTIERLDRIVSTAVAGGAITFFFATVSYGWYQAFVVMAH